MTTDPSKRQAPKPERAVIEWPLENPHPDQLDLPMDESEGKPSRWNTLRALRVLDWYSA